LASAGIGVLRAGSSRILGVALVVTSAILFLISYVTGYIGFEIASLISFVLGVALLAVELEPRVRLSVAGESMLGYVHSLDSTLHELKATGKATYVPLGNQVTMVLAREDGSPELQLPPVGEEIQQEFQGEVGEMNLKGIEFFNTWVPKVIEDNLSLAAGAKAAWDGPDLKFSMNKPFVRRLCVDQFVNANVCCRMGCPLAAAVAQSLGGPVRELHLRSEDSDRRDLAQNRQERVVIRIH
jgi:hypothetical protein